MIGELRFISNNGENKHVAYLFAKANGIQLMTLDAMAKSANSPIYRSKDNDYAISKTPDFIDEDSDTTYDCKMCLASPNGELNIDSLQVDKTDKFVFGYYSRVDENVTVHSVLLCSLKKGLVSYYTIPKTGEKVLRIRQNDCKKLFSLIGLSYVTVEEVWYDERRSDVPLIVEKGLKRFEQAIEKGRF